MSTQLIHASCPPVSFYLPGQGWDWGDDFDNIKAYLHRWTGRASWRK